jgi:hypothetical protein
MPEQNQDRTERNYAAEPGPQPDPALHEGSATTARTWVVTGVIAAALLAVMYGITAEHNGDRNEAPQVTTGANQPPNQSGGRTTNDAPPNPAVTSEPKSGG